MKNKAKCKLCQDIIESFHSTDHVQCKCTALALGGGLAMKIWCDNWEDVLRIDDNGNELPIKSNDCLIKKDEKEEISYPKQSKEDLINQLHEMAKYIETLPQHAMSSPISHYDLFSLTALLVAIFRSDLKEES